MKTNKEILKEIETNLKSLKNITPVELKKLSKISDSIEELKTKATANYHPYSVTLIEACEEAVRNFGKYNFIDKDSSEYVDYEKLKSGYLALKQPDRVQVAKEMSKHPLVPFVLGYIIGDIIDGELLPENESEEIQDTGKWV